MAALPNLYLRSDLDKTMLQTFWELDAEVHPEQYDPPSPEPPLPAPPMSVRRGEIAGFLRVTRRMTDPGYSQDESLWYCDCYCGNQVAEIPERWVQSERTRDPENTSDWWVCHCGQELNEPPIAYPKEYELRVKLRGARLPPIYKPELLRPPKLKKFSHFRLAFIAATFPPHWEDNGRSLISKELRQQVLLRGGYKCKHCGTDKDLTMDHIQPVVQGGPTIIWNLQILCRRCNSRKGAR